jgi:hypothetical protein
MDYQILWGWAEVNGTSAVGFVWALDIDAVFVAYLIVIIEKVNHKCIEIGWWRMSKMKDENKLNKNTLMIYKIFQDDPFGSYSVDDT